MVNNIEDTVKPKNVTVILALSELHRLVVERELQVTAQPGMFHDAPVSACRWTLV